MGNNENFKLCQDLLNAESEDEIIFILRKSGYWENDSVWYLLGGVENNYSIAGNQKEDPVDALVEKFVNSVDAVLTKECWKEGIHPESEGAPQSISDALERYFGIKKGNLANIDALTRTELASNIGFIATGSRRLPNFIVFDRGEGQTPKKMPDTFLSLAKDNKLKIPFVQGQFNQGGTAVLRFCGNRSFQMFISRRFPEITDPNDETSDYWGFTIIRREDPSGGRKSSTYTYLAPGGEILKFLAPNLLIPGHDEGTQDIPPLEYGALLKLYEYELPGGLKTNIKLDLYYKVSLLLPKLGLPVRFYERRDYKSHSAEATLAGLGVRLEDDKKENIEPDFPGYEEFTAQDEKFIVWIYAFKKGRSEKYKKNEGIIFTHNGQTQGTIPNSFFTRRSIGMSYLSASILVIVDCDRISRLGRERLFMNSRDRLSRGGLRGSIEKEIVQILRNHQGLRKLREKRRREAVDSKLADSKPLQEVLNDVIRKSPALQSLFTKGTDIKNPFKSRLVGEVEKFVGKHHPTFFNIMSGHEHKQCHINQRFRIQFETDVVNEYFGRDRYPGRYKLKLNGNFVSTTNFVLNLWNGVATLTAKLPEDTKIGDMIQGDFWVLDDALLEPFTNKFSREVLGLAKKRGGPKTRRTPPAGNGNGQRQLPDGLSMPKVVEIREDLWEQHEFDRFSALKVVDSGEGSFDFYVNLDNVFLRTELKNLKRDEDSKLMEARFKYALVLFGLAILKDQEIIVINKESYSDVKEDEQIPIENIIFNTSRAIAPILLPMIDVLGDLDIKDMLGVSELEIDQVLVS